MAEPLPFDQLYKKVQDLKGQGAGVDVLTKAVTEAGTTPEAYKARVAQVRANASNPVYAAVSGVADAATFGLADEAGGLVDAATSYLKGDNKSASFGDVFHEATANRRAEQQAAGELHPWLKGGGQVVGALASTPLLPEFGLGAAAAKAGAAVVPETIGRMAARSGIQGAIGGAAYGAGSGTDAGSRVLGAGEGGVLGLGTGAVLGAAGKVVGSALGRGAGPAVVDASGNLTPQATDLLRRQRIDPNSVDPQLASRAALELAGGGTGPRRQVTAQSLAGTVRRLIGEKHGVDLTVPEATFDTQGKAALQEALGGVRGPAAMHAAQENVVAGQDQFGRAAGDLAQKVAPGAVGGMGEGSTAELVGKGVNKAADDAWARVGQAYQAAGADKHVIPAAETASLLPGIQARVTASKMVATPEIAPKFANALQVLQHYVVGQDTTLAHLDAVRKGLGVLARDPGTSETDRSMLRLAIGGFDDWTDRAANAQASTLPAQSVAALKQARGMAKQWFGTFEAHPTKPDTVGPMIERMRAAAEDPHLGAIDHGTLFDKLMGSGSGFDEQARPLLERTRSILGDTSPEWQTLQQGMVRRILFGDAGKQAMHFQPGEQAWKTMSTRIDKALDGEGGDLARQALGDDAVKGLLQLREIARAKSVTGKALSTGSGYTVKRAMLDAGKVAGFASGPSAGAYLGGALTGGSPLGAAVGAGVGVGAAALGGAMRNRAQLAAVEKLLGAYQAPRAGPGITLPGMSAYGPGELAEILRRRQEGQR